MRATGWISSEIANFDGTLDDLKNLYYTDRDRNLECSQTHTHDPKNSFHEALYDKNTEKSVLHYSYLHNAIHKNDIEMTKWLLEQDCLTTKYAHEYAAKNGTKYGATDYIIHRETTENGTKKGIGMHIGSLLFHQIAKHHFFQDQSSDYRVDPKKLIDMFDLLPETCYMVPVIEKKYRAMTSADGSRLDLLSPATPSCMDVTNTELWSILESNEDFILYQRIEPQNEQEKLANYCVIALKEYPESTVVHQDISYPISLRRNYYSDEIRIVKKPIQVC